MSRPGAVTLGPGVYRIPIAPRDLLSCFALVDDDGAVTVVDAGPRFAVPRFLVGLAAIGRTPADVTRIVATHAHAHQSGGLAEVRRASAGRAPAGAGVATVAAHERESIYLRTGRPPRARRSWASSFLGRLPGHGFAPVEVDEELADGVVLAVAGGLRVLHTPGHTPGHISLLHEPSGVLLTGDALVNVCGLGYPRGATCTDLSLARRSAHRLGDAEFTVAAFTHGPEIRDHARETVRSFLRGSSPQDISGVRR